MNNPRWLLRAFGPAALLALVVGISTACVAQSKDVGTDTPPTAPAVASSERKSADAPKPPVITIGQVIHVDPVDGDDANDGASASPLRTIAAALKSLKAIEGPATVQLAAGVYREGDLRITRRDAPLLVQGSTPGETIISGAEVWTQWAERDGTLVAPWPHDWGEYKLDSGYPKRDREAFRPAGKRSEIVVVDGQRLTQVIHADELTPGSYRVDLEADELIVRLPEGKSAGSTVIEVGMRPNLLAVLQAKNVTLRNLVFTHAVSSHTRKDVQFGNYGVAIFGEHVKGEQNSVRPDRTFAENITLEDCWFIGNNSSGLTVSNTRHLTARRCRFDDNGNSGVGANRIQHVVWEGCSFDRNNWRLGLLGNVYGWGPAGTKQLFADDVAFVRCTFRENHATGLWLDTGNTNIRVEDSKMIGNAGNGLYYEWSPGPMTVTRSRIERNGFGPMIDVADGGVLFAEAEQLTLDDCVIADNVNFQIAARPRDRPGVGYWNDRAFDGQCRGLTLRNSEVVGGTYRGENVPEFYAQKHRTASLIGRHVHAVEAQYATFLETYVGKGNRFHHSDTESVFSTGRDYGYDRIDLRGWQQLTGQDSDSQWGSAR
jgi:hypothetical protein